MQFTWCIFWVFKAPIFCTWEKFFTTPLHCSCIWFLWKLPLTIDQRRDYFESNHKYYAQCEWWKVDDGVLTNTAAMLYAILQACKAHILSCKPLPRGIVILETNKCNFVWTEHMTSNNSQPTASTRWGMWRLVQMVRCGVVTQQNLYKMSRFIRINILTTARGLHHRCCTAGPFVTLSHAAALIGAFMAPSWIWCRWRGVRVNIETFPYA